MSEPSDDHKVNLAPSPGQGGSRRPVMPETPFSILVVGDFSGRGVGAKAGSELDWNPVRVTPDNLPDLAGFTTELDLSLPEAPHDVSLTIDGLRAFHPDELARRLPHVTELLAERERVLAGQALSERFKPDSHPPGPPAETAEDSREDAGEEAPEPDTDRELPPGDLLDAILDQTSGVEPGPRGPDAELEAFVKEAVRPYTVSETKVDEGDRDIVDRAVAGALKAVLAGERFRRLEALWRSLVFLVSRIDAGGKTRVYIVDASRVELETELAGSAASLRQLLSEPGLGPAVPRWACIVGAYSFGRGEQDALTLARLGRLASEADVPWVSEAVPECVGSPSWESTLR